MNPLLPVAEVVGKVLHQSSCNREQEASPNEQGDRAEVAPFCRKIDTEVDSIFPYWFI